MRVDETRREGVSQWMKVRVRECRGETERRVGKNVDQIK